MSISRAPSVRAPCSRSRGAMASRCRPTSAGELAAIYEFRDFPHFLDVWSMTTSALRTEQDFRQVVVDYAAEAAAHGAVYLEGIFSPSEPAGRGVRWEEVFAGYCDGAAEAFERHGVRVALTPDIVRGYPLEAAELTVTHSIAHADRGIVGVGLGGSEGDYPPGLYARAFARAKEGGLGSVPHAGEAEGPDSVRGALDTLARRPDQARDPGRRGSRPARRAGRPRHRARCLPDLERAHRRGAHAGRASASRASRRRRPVHGQHRRPGHVRQQPGHRVRDGAAPRSIGAGVLRGWRAPARSATTRPGPGCAGSARISTGTRPARARTSAAMLISRRRPRSGPFGRKVSPVSDM